MMGRSHLCLGAAGYLGAVAAFPSLTGGAASSAELVAGTLVASGAAMLPDLDHPQGTVSRCLGPVSQTASAVIAKLAGGHRKGTHTLWAWAATVALAAWALHGTSGPWVALGVAFVCSSLLLRTLTEADGAVCALMAAVLGGLAVIAAPSPDWMVTAIAVGYGLHLLGDVVTTEGLQPLYPIPAKLVIPVIGSTDRWRERTTGALCGLAAFYGLVTMVFVPTWDAQTAAAKPKPAVAAPQATPQPLVERVVSNAPRAAHQELVRARRALARARARAGR